MAQEPSERPGGPGGPYANQILEALYAYRTEEFRYGMPIAELARRVGIERRDMSWIANGHRLPSADQLDRICDVLGWTPEQLYPTAAFRDAIEATRREAEEPA